MSRRLERLKRLTPEELEHQRLVGITIQSGALEALGMYKHDLWEGRGEIEADTVFFDGAETRLVFPGVDAKQTTVVAVGAALIPTGETVVYVTSDGREIFRAPYMGDDLRRKVTTALNADAAERKTKGFLPPHVEFRAA